MDTFFPTFYDHSLLLFGMMDVSGQQQQVKQSVQDMSQVLSSIQEIVSTQLNAFKQAIRKNKKKHSTES